MSRTKYESDRKKEDFTFHPARRFEAIWDTDPGNCSLYALDDRQAALLRSMLAVFPKYHWVWGMPSPRKDWTPAQTQQWVDISDFVEELEAVLVGGCDLQEFINTQKRLVGAITGEVITVEEDGQQVAYDYSTIGLGPRVDGLSARFGTDNWVVPDENIADILANSLFGRYINFTNPFTGTGVADIVDEQLDTLHKRLRMTDSSIFNPLGEKNITEALETLLRRDKLTDLEFITPNIVTVMEQIFNTGDTAVVAVLKNVVKRVMAQLDLPPEVVAWMDGKLDVEERLSTADILLMMALADGNKGEGGGTKALISALSGLDMQTNITLNNGCGCDGDCDCPGEEKNLTLDDLCEGEDEVVNV